MPRTDERIDRLVVARGLAPSRERARALVLAGRVVVAGHRVDKPGTRVPADAELRVKGGERPYVSRGGEKLAAALDAFAVDVRGGTVLDVGASTGGFTDCVLQRGAKRVFAVDVGRNQLAWSLRQDPRVVSLERTNVRTWEGAEIDEPISLVTIDVSFISLRLVLPTVRRVAPGAELIALVKPQFEVGRELVGKGGVVRDDRLRERAAAGVVSEAEALGYRSAGHFDSPVHGPKGNREIFVRLLPAGGGQRRLPPEPDHRLR